MRISVLCENTSDSAALLAEHGLSLYVETKRHVLLFDMGQSGIFAENARVLGADLSAVDVAVLSHGHYDHAGGVKTFLQLNAHSPVYANEHVLGDYYNGTEKYIGVDKSLSESGRIFLVGDEYAIDEGLTLYSCNAKKRPFATDAFGLTEKRDDAFCPDSFLHEQYLLIEEDGKRVLLSGCSHKGVLNILSWFRPDVFVGGFHFTKLDSAGDGRPTLCAAAENMLSYPTRYYTCHCTGAAQYGYLKSLMGERVSYLSTGTIIDI